VIRFVSKYDTSVDQNERAKGGYQSDEWLQNLDDVDHPLGLGEEFQSTRNDGDHSFSIVCRKVSSC